MRMEESMFFRSHKPHSESTPADSHSRTIYSFNEPHTRAAAPSQPAPQRGAGDASGPIHNFLERSATVVFPFLFIPALLSSYQRLAETAAEWLSIPGALFGLILGDFVSGIVHWVADTYGNERTPVIGRSMVRPFRVHHVRPLEICEHGIVETVGNTCILAAPLLALSLALGVWGGYSAAAAFVIFASVVTVGVTVATNQFHKWAHQAAPPRLVRALQRSRIILHPEHHRAHHTAPFESSYAITNGWLNPLLNRTGFFRRLEGALRTFGIEPSAVGRSN